MAEIALDIRIDVGKREKDIQIGIAPTRKDIELTVDKGSGAYIPDYEGEYEVESALYEAHILGTKNKRMTDNMTVRPIPIYEVQNPSGGMTITIGN